MYTYTKCVNVYLYPHLYFSQNRTSGDSGFDSQHPTPSPSPTEPSRYASSCDSPSPTHTTYLTPNPSLTLSPHSTPSHTVYVTPVVSTTTTTVTHLTPQTFPSTPTHQQGQAHTAMTPPRSKSSDAIRTLTIIPSTTSQQRSPSAELVREVPKSKSSPSTPKKVKKSGIKRESKKKISGGGGLFGFGRSKTSSSPARRMNSSPGKRRGSDSKRRGSLTPPTNQPSLDLPTSSTQKRARSSSSVDLTKV